MECYSEETYAIFVVLFGLLLAARIKLEHRRADVEHLHLMLDEE